MRVVKIPTPPDKSISHRAVMLASISEGTTHIKNLLLGDDVLRTIDAFRAMGVDIELKAIPRFRSGQESLRFKGEKRKRDSANVVVRGVGRHGLKKPAKPIYLGNSGTTMRILPGILAGQDFEVVLEGDRSLSDRPMRRIVEPLTEMGAEVLPLTLTLSPKGRRKSKGEVYPPLKIRGGRLKAIECKSKIASAQVKSCILLAGLFANGVTSVTEPVKSRDHTERMLRMFGCRVSSTRKGRGCRVSLKGPIRLKNPDVIGIPGDISSAAFFIVAGCILPDTKIIFKNVGLNPTRTGVLDILRKMGADIKITENPSAGSGLRPSAGLGAGRVERTEYEPSGNITVKSSRLKGVTISPEEVVAAIDEISIIMVAGCFARGTTVIRGISELRVKETDRIKSMVTNLRRLGGDIIVKGLKEKEEIIINGGKTLHGAMVSSFGDHRTAMSMIIAGLAAKGKIQLDDTSCINKSFPNFIELTNKLFSDRIFIKM